MYSQEINVFEILERVVPYKSLEYTLHTLKDYKKYDNGVFYKDEKYFVRITCRGEWGGSVWFTNNLTGIEYSCAATCVKSVNKYKGSYIVTTSLWHGSGSSSILRIKDPSKMEVFLKPKPREEIIKPPYYLEDLESKSRKGVETLWSDYGGVMINFSFVYDDVLYHVVEKEDKTYLARLERGKLIEVGLLSNKSIWSHFNLLQLGKEHLFLFLGKPYSIRGYIEIIGDKIDLVWYSRTKRQH